MKKVYTIGIDEVGRGPLAGPLVVCACAVEVGCKVTDYYPKKKLLDSKKLTHEKRKDILEQITVLTASKQVLFGLGEASNSRIDEIGLRAAIKESLAQALNALHEEGVGKDSFVFLDGSLKAPDDYEQETVIRGDEKIPEVSLASIYAKEYRDALMKKIAERFPEYHFESHVGYGTRAHYEAIKNHGTTALHRMSFLSRVGMFTDREETKNGRKTEAFNQE